MQECEFSYDIKVRTSSVSCDIEMIEIVEAAAPRVAGFKKIARNLDFRGGGDDAAHIINEVQKHGGRATYIKMGSGSTVPLHDSSFEVDEAVLSFGAHLITEIVEEAGRRTGNNAF